MSEQPVVTNKTVGWVLAALFLATIPLANFFVENVGTFCIPKPGGPCLIPVWPYPYLDTVSGVLFAGIAFVLRDLVQEALGKFVVIGAIVVGAIMSYFLSSPALAIASGVTFLIAEAIDFFVYNKMRAKGFIYAVIASSVVGIVVDSILFLQIAFGHFKYLPGQIVAKLYMIALGAAVLYWLRARMEQKDKA